MRDRGRKNKFKTSITFFGCHGLKHAAIFLRVYIFFRKTKTKTKSLFYKSLIFIWNVCKNIFYKGDPLKIFAFKFFLNIHKKLQKNCR